MMLRDQEFRDISALMDQIARQHEFHDGDVLLALVRDPATHQQLVRVKRLTETAYLTRHDRASTTLREAMEQLSIPARDERGITFRTLTVVVRRGLTVFGIYESNWMLAWRYSNHFQDAFTSDVTLVTEHGWHDFMSDEAGDEPRLVA